MTKSLRIVVYFFLVPLLLGSVALFAHPRAPWIQEWVAACIEPLAVIFLVVAAALWRDLRRRETNSRRQLFLCLVVMGSLVWVWLAAMRPLVSVRSVPGSSLVTRVLFDTEGMVSEKSKFDVVISPAGILDSLPYRAVVDGVTLSSRFPVVFAGSLGEDIPRSLVGAVDLPRGKLNVAYLGFSPPWNSENFYKNRVLIRRLATVTRHSTEPWIVFAPAATSFLGRTHRNITKAARLDDVLKHSGRGVNWLMPAIAYEATPFGVYSRNLEAVAVSDVSGSDHLIVSFPDE